LNLLVSYGLAHDFAIDLCLDRAHVACVDLLQLDLDLCPSQNALHPVEVVVAVMVVASCLAEEEHNVADDDDDTVLVRGRVVA